MEAKPDIALPHVTAALWIQPTAVPSGSDFTADHWIVDGWKGRENYGIYLRGNKIWAAFHKINTGEIHVQSDAAIVAGTLYHIAMSFDGTQLKLYVNGTLQADQKSSSGGDDVPGPTPTDLSLGMNRVGTQRYQGLMDEFRLYDRALSLTDVQALKGNIATGLKAHFAFEGGSGLDSSGNNLTANMTAVTPVTGPHAGAGDAAQFDGISSGAEVTPSIPMSSQMTVAAWVKPLSFGVGSIRPIVMKAAPGWGGEVDFHLCITPEGRVFFPVNTIDGYYGQFVDALSINAVPLNTWSHLVGVIDQTQNQVRIYINGTLDGTFSMGGRAVRNTNRVLRIGSRNDNQAVNYFHGAIDEVRIYQRALGVIDIGTLMSLVPPVLSPPGSDLDLDQLPNVWEAQFGLSTTSENFRVGNQSEGSLNVPVGQTVYVNNDRIMISVVQPAGRREIHGVIAPNTKIGDVFLMHLTQAGLSLNEQDSGQNEFVTVYSVSPGKIVITKPLSFTYDPTDGSKIQCVKVPQYNSVDVFGTLSAPAWNGTSGGILVFIANDVFVASTGKVDVSEKGFRGGIGWRPPGNEHGPVLIGYQGEGRTAFSFPLPKIASENFGGGGGGGGAYGSTGGNLSGNGGGGGGHSQVGQSGATYSYYAAVAGPGVGGSPASSTGDLLTFGGGGGSGGGNSPWGYYEYGGYGGSGGGAILIVARTITNGGAILADGGIGESHLYHALGYYDFAANRSPGGGGAGGRVFITSRISGSGLLSANFGDSGSQNSPAGDGSVGKIGIERGAALSTPSSVTTGDGYFGEQPLAFLVQYQDSDSDGLDDLAEFRAGSSPIIGDTDGDLLPDLWEVSFNTQVSVVDGSLDPDGDGLTNRQEFAAGSHPRSSDGDNDGTPDTVEIGVHGTNPMMADTDGDGMNDHWEVLNSLNPLRNDAFEDRDLDGLTNKEEFDGRFGGLLANAANSKEGLPDNDGLSDYRRLRGEGWVRRSYDAKDRLIATERDTGFAQRYTYDGNSNKIRDVSEVSFDVDRDGLPDTWELTYQLLNTSGSSGNGPEGDPDNDGLSNFVEWKNGTNPTVADFSQFQPVTRLAMLTAPNGTGLSRWMMVVGQFDGLNAEDLVVTSDAIPTPGQNVLTTFFKQPMGWRSEAGGLGAFGISSMVLGKSPAGSGQQLLFGRKAAGSRPAILQAELLGDRWKVLNNTPLAEGSVGTQADAVSLGVSGRPVYHLTADGGVANRLHTQDWNPRQFWAAATDLGISRGATSQSMQLQDGRLGIWDSASQIRLYASSGISAPPDAVRISPTGSHYALSPYLNLVEAWNHARSLGPYADLATIDSAEENAWLREMFDPGAYWIGIERPFRTDPGDPAVWRWHSGLASSYRNWAPGHPLADREGENQGLVDNRYAPTYAVMMPDGKWQSTANTQVTYYDRDAIYYYYLALPGLIEVQYNAESKLLPALGGASNLLWKGKAFASGALRSTQTEQTPAVVAALLADTDSSGGVSPGDAFVVGEYSAQAATPVLTTSAPLAQTNPNPQGAYGLTVLRRKSAATPGVVAIGEPNGTVSLWMAPNATDPLVRKVFTTEFIGKAWHQMEPLKEADGREGLVGLLVDPAMPNQCQVIHWGPDAIEAALNGTAPVLNNAPLARVLPSPGSGAGSSAVGVRIWDAEAHASRFLLQYQRAGETAWNAATVVAVDGNPAGTTGTHSSQPGGVTHTAQWDAAGDLGGNFSGTVLLRTQATDSQSLAGAWSDAMPYAVNTAADRDSDGDGALDTTEAAFGTNPNAASSRPTLLVTRNANGGLRFLWPTSVGRTYRLEATTDVTTGPWAAVQSGLAAAPVNVAAPAAGVPRRFYRVVAE